MSDLTTDLVIDDQEPAVADIPPVNATLGLVIYTDGGARPQNGRAGWGLHGYLYSTAVPKKGSGHPTHVPTSQGYVSKSELVTPTGIEYQPITPLFYLDGTGSFMDNTSNNVAELRALFETVQIAERFGRTSSGNATQGYQLTTALIPAKGASFEDYTQLPLTTLTIYSDSKYVVEGLKSLPTWKSRNWTLASGDPVKNQNYWKKIDEVVALLRASGTQVDLSWVKAHTDDSNEMQRIVGNIYADMLATVGVYHAKHNVVLAEIDYTPADGYWKSEVDRHVFLNLPLLYFSDAYREGTDTYFLASRTKVTSKIKVDSAAISTDPDASYALVIMKEDQDQAVKTVVNYHRDCLNSENSLNVLYLDDLYNSTQYRYLLRYGHFTMENIGQYKTELKTSLDRVVASELQPPGNAYRTIEIATSLATFLQEPELLQDRHITYTDLTAVFYDRETKKSGEHYVLNPSFKVGMSTHRVTAHYCVSPDSTIHQTDLQLRLGIDLPDRNTLKRMEALKPTVTLLTYVEDGVQLRYVIRIDTAEAKGVWAAWYSNLKLIG